MELRSKKIALYGVNPSSSSDHSKLLAYKKWYQQYRNHQCSMVFYNYASLAECYQTARGALNRFDAVICTNNIVASSFVQHAWEDGIAIPDDLYVAAMTDSLLLQHLSVPVTAVSPDYMQIGKQAVMLYAFLSHQKGNSRVSISVPFRFSIRESTDLMPWTQEVEEDQFQIPNTAPEPDFYSDPDVLLFSKADRLMNIYDDTDIKFIRGLMSGNTYDQISQNTYLTIDSLKYRKKRMMKAVSCNDPEDFLFLLRFCEKLKLFQ